MPWRASSPLHPAINLVRPRVFEQLPVPCEVRIAPQMRHPDPIFHGLQPFRLGQPERGARRQHARPSEGVAVARELAVEPRHRRLDRL